MRVKLKTMRNNQDTRNNDQTIINNQISIIKQKNMFGYWNLKFGICLVIVSWLLVISPALSLYAEEVAKIIAKVNNRVVTSKDLDDYSKVLKMHLNDSRNDLSSDSSEFRRTALARLIEDMLILEEARSKKIEVPRQVIDGRLSQIIASYPAREDFDASLRERGFTVTSLKERLKEQYLMREIIESEVKSLVSISPQEVSSYYSENKDKILSPLTYIFYIATTNNKDQLVQIGKKINADGIEPAQAAAKGQLGKLALTKDELKLQISEILERLKPQEVEIAKIGELYYLLYLEEKIAPRPLTLGEAQEQIYEYLGEIKFKQRFSQWVGQLKEKALIKIYAEEKTSSD